MLFRVLPRHGPSHEQYHGLHPGSELYMSGFYVDDIAVIREEAEKNGLAFVHYKEKNRWAEVKFIYQG